MHINNGRVQYNGIMCKYNETKMRKKENKNEEETNPSMAKNNMISVMHPFSYLNLFKALIIYVQL